MNEKSLNEVELDLDEIPLLEDVVVPDSDADASSSADAEWLRQQLSADLQEMVDEAVDQAVAQIMPQLRQTLQREIRLRFEQHLTDAVRLMLNEQKG